MSVIIFFPNGQNWFKANWVFRQLGEDVSKAFPSNTEVIGEFEKAQAIGALFLDKMEGPLCSRVIESIRSVADATVQGRIQGWRPEDEQGHRMYLESLVELLDLVKAQ